MNIITSVY